MRAQASLEFLIAFAASLAVVSISLHIIESVEAKAVDYSELLKAKSLAAEISSGARMLAASGEGSSISYGEKILEGWEIANEDGGCTIKKFGAEQNSEHRGLKPAGSLLLPSTETESPLNPAMNGGDSVWVVEIQLPKTIRCGRGINLEAKNSIRLAKKGGAVILGIAD